MKAILVLLSLFILSSNLKAEIRCYLLNQYEYTDNNNKEHTTEILDMNNKKMEIKLYISGFGTNHITAQAPIYPLAKEVEILPMKYKYYENKSETTGRVWYYVVSDQGITVLEFYENNSKIKLHNLGGVVYTYIGNYSK
jgi:hypothetical protein